LFCRFFPWYPPGLGFRICKNSRNANKKWVSIFSKRAQKPGMNSRKIDPIPPHTFSLWAPQLKQVSQIQTKFEWVPWNVPFGAPSLIGQRKGGDHQWSGALFWGVWWWCKVTGLSMWCFSRHWSYLLWSIPNWV